MLINLFLLWVEKDKLLDHFRFNELNTQNCFAHELIRGLQNKNKQHNVTPFPRNQHSEYITRKAAVYLHVGRAVVYELEGCRFDSQS